MKAPVLAVRQAGEEQANAGQWVCVRGTDIVCRHVEETSGQIEPFTAKSAQVLN